MDRTTKIALACMAVIIMGAGVWIFNMGFLQGAIFGAVGTLIVSHFLMDRPLSKIILEWVMQRDDRHLIFAVLFVLVLVVVFLCSGRGCRNKDSKVMQSRMAVVHQVITVTRKNRAILLQKPNFGPLYVAKYPEPKFENLHMLGEVSKWGTDTVDGKILRTLRFRNITEAVECRYGLPKNILLAMVLEETTGADLLPNGQGDGGFGIIHMQCLTAREFGLKTFNGCNELRDRQAHKGLSAIIDKHPDRKIVMRYDDRLHPVLNIDAAGRMLAYYMAGPRLGNLSRTETAIRRYAGKWNYASYRQDIYHNIKCLSSRAIMRIVETRFNSVNKALPPTFDEKGKTISLGRKGFRINGKLAGFDEYEKTHQEQNYNYGLEAYKKLPRYHIESK